eukprot:11894456-Karenia_brevis.AAC.1
MAVRCPPLPVVGPSPLFLVSLSPAGGPLSSCVLGSGLPLFVSLCVPTLPWPLPSVGLLFIMI